MYLFGLAIAVILVTSPEVVTNHIAHWLMDLHEKGNG